MQTLTQKPPSEQFKKIALCVWIALLFPWPLFAGLSGMALDAGESFRVYAFLVSAWVYPGFVALAYVLRKNSPVFQLIPLIDIVAILVFGR